MKDQEVAQAELDVFRTGMLMHAERQTKALESINTYLMRTLAVVVLVLLVALVAWLSS